MRIRNLIFFGLLIELATLIGLGALVGFWPTIATVFGTFVLGGAFLRTPGMRISGVLLMIPGLVTDLAGLVFLLPGPRRMAARLAQWFLLRGVPAGRVQRVVTFGGVPPGAGHPGGMPPGWQPGPMPGAMPGEPAGTIEAEVIEVRESPDQG